MASLLCRSGVFYATFSDSSRKPRQRRHSLKTRNKRTAERLLSRLDDGYREGTFDPWTQEPEDFLHSDRVTQPVRVEEAIALYLQQVAATLTATTLRTRTALLKRFAEHVGPKAFLERLTPQQVKSFVSAGNAARSTQSTRLIDLKAFCTFCLKNGMLRKSPAHCVEAPQRPERFPTAVTDRELEAVLNALPKRRAWTRKVFQFAAVTGLRAGELARLKWTDVDEANRVLRISEQKNKKAQTQPIPLTALAILQGLPRRGEYVFNSPFVRKAERNVETWTNGLALAFQLGRERAGIERKITPHGLRHRYCTKLAEAGANAFLIAAAARHADVKTSQRYVSIANERLKAELDAVFG